ncbi:hypothetical protein COEREDRAFT_7152 [Coemansia reversa NRRL 1564]|uniref:Uncharacterized protein n=1 Tax=Coemansia reversa (strain ATCC 12441 / NRRL 1564) TaxID=763665 RepID=A0A2G5BGY0_COERN|nr:hypothetical protein COEREDRAFT_7152 [Coemansia reversa NRRL 1564]|eukprot:PIA17977.1 hypothetical protein COEREDRAFT_7152 [Coemansia reversa NRRL 1564]
MSRIIGKAEESLGRITDNPKLEAKGHEKRVHAHNKTSIKNNPAAYLDRAKGGTMNNYNAGVTERSPHHQTAGQQSVPQHYPEAALTEHTPHRNLADQKEMLEGHPAGGQIYSAQHHQEAGPTSYTQDYATENQGNRVPDSREANPSPTDVYQVHKDTTGYNDRNTHGNANAVGQPMEAYNQPNPTQYQQNRGQFTINDQEPSGMSKGMSIGMGSAYEMKGSAQRKLGSAIGNPKMEQRGREQQMRGANEKVLADQEHLQQHSA